MSRLVMNITTLLFLAACTTQQAANIQTANARMAPVIIVECKVDKLAQPIFVPLAGAVMTAVAPAAASVITGAVALDMSVVHPAIVQACAAVDAAPVAAVPAAQTAAQ